MKKNRRNIIKITTIGFAGLLISVIILLIISNSVISGFSDKYLYDDITKVPYNKAGVMLGTSKFLSNGNPNLYFFNRIDAAVELYKVRKIEYIIISGDNSTPSYNEPKLMKKELIKRGIPENRIILDYAGFRTFDSMIRAKEVFGQSQFTVISQRFHNERAVFIAHKYGINAIGFNAKDVSLYSGFKTMVREKFARVKVFIDLLTGNQPKFLGDKISIDTINVDSLKVDSLRRDSL